MTKMTTKKYEAFFYRQREKSPVQCTFVATSADVFDWASVPTKTEKNLRYFQRPELESHVDEIKVFFTNYEENCSPSSIVVGFKERVRAYQTNGQELEFDMVKP